MREYKVRIEVYGDIWYGVGARTHSEDEPSCQILKMTCAIAIAFWKIMNPTKGRSRLAFNLGPNLPQHHVTRPRLRSGRFLVATPSFVVTVL